MEKSNISVIEDIKLMLGHPIRQVELTDEQIDVANRDAQDTLFLYSKLYSANYDSIKDIWIKKYTLANCKEILGRVRGKFEGKVGIDESPKYMDYKSLLNEAESEKYNLKLDLK